MTHVEIREKFLKFFVDRGHTIVPSSSLLPDDPSVLFTTAGMQQFKKYYTEPKLAPSLNVVSIQKSMRTSDIDEVGDDSHLTFFEMLGNFSFGGYFKKEAIQYAYDFIAKDLGLKIDYVTVYLDDTESEKIWHEVDPSLEIKKMGKADNWWGPTGDQGPCGPTTEIYVNGIEIWNVVFNQYFQDKSGTLQPLETPGIDTGMGLERLAMVLQGKQNIFQTDLFEYAKSYSPVVADHARATAFLITDGVLPSNKDQGYVLRRLMRRIIVHKEIDFKNIFVEIAKIYPINLEKVQEIFEQEKSRFFKTLDIGIRELKKIAQLDAVNAFRLYQSYGLPFEVMHDVVPALNRAEFDEEFKKHQAKSREGSVKKFGGHGLLLDNGEIKAVDERELEICTKLHTATHLLQAALRQILGNEVHQDGSDITAERLRFDFTFNRKLTPEEIKEVEDLVNQKIQENLDVWNEKMSYEDAIKSGALYFKKVKYPEIVKVYSMGKNAQEIFSKEFCGGPHVEHTITLNKFKITKEEAVSTGVRRIRATVV